MARRTDPERHDDGHDDGLAWTALGELKDWRDEIHASAIFLTRLPIRWQGDMPRDLAARSLRAGPIVGAVIGLGGGLVFATGLAAGLPPALAALFAVAAQIVLTGGLHEDGLADLADGLGGGRDRMAKLEIMRDSRIGSYGALALVLAVGARALALAALAPMEGIAALAAVGAVSRAAWPALMTWLPPARDDGLAATHGRQPLYRLAVTLGLAVAFALLVLPFAGALVALAAAAVAVAGIGLLAWRQIGGHTGDVLGGTQQAVEIAMLAALAALA
ncbi:MAG: adenosylcobinamide-GDP ribazoletransferase [Inquilinus sp.]|nr:adenosylcobinamide-GDP ribazoletransferase [Inquilinus sp.]